MAEAKGKELDLSRYGYVPGDRFVAYVSSYTRTGKEKVGIRVYDVDVEKLKTLVQAFISKDERVRQDPAPFFRLTEYGESYLNFTLRAWTDSSIYWDVRFDLLENLLALLRENEIEIPRSKLDVRLVETEGEV